MTTGGRTRASFTAHNLPRLFRQTSHAQKALNWWLDGPIHIIDADDCDMVAKKDPTRIKADYEIVKITLIVQNV